MKIMKKTYEKKHIVLPILLNFIIFIIILFFSKIHDFGKNSIVYDELEFEKQIYNNIETNNYDNLEVSSVKQHIDEKTGETYVTYEDFYNGESDDYYSIIKAHTYANMNNCKVIATKKEYNIYKNESSTPINIKTNTDWQGATFYIHDEVLTDEVAQQSIFRISGYGKCTILNNKDQLKDIHITKETKKVNELAGYGEAICIVYNSNKLQYKRIGSENYQGDPQTDVFKIDNEGKILNDVEWDFEEITKIMIIENPKNQITIKNGNFISILNGKENKDYYYQRNIICERSNTIIENINHFADDDEKIGGPYYGFLMVRYSSDVIIKDSTLYAHKYKVISNYDLSILFSTNIYLNNLKNNNILDDSRWGCIVTGYTKDIVYDSCRLNRIDAHTGVHNLTIKNCEIGYAGICVIGSGKLNIINSTNFDDRGFIILRPDYGSTWNGEILIQDCNYNVDSKKVLIVNTKSSYDNDGKVHDYGYKLYLPNIEINNLQINNKSLNSKVYIFDNSEDNDILITHKIMNEIKVLNETSGEIIPFYQYDDVLNSVKYYNENIQSQIDEIIDKNKEFDRRYNFNALNVSDAYENFLMKLQEIKDKNMLFQFNIKIDDIYEKQFEFINIIVIRYYDGVLNMKDNDYTILVRGLINIFDNYKNLYRLCNINDDISNEKLISKINNVVNKYNANLDIEIPLADELIKEVKDIYANNLNSENSYENYLNKQRILNTCEVIETIQDNAILKKAQEESKEIKMIYNYESNVITNQIVQVQVQLPSNKCVIENNTENKPYKFDMNGSKEIIINIRGYEYSYEIKVTNIDKTSPIINGVGNGKIYTSKITPTITDENIDTIKLILNGEEVKNFKSGTTLTEEGFYTLTAIDKAGNKTQISFQIMENNNQNYIIQDNIIKNISEQTIKSDFDNKLKLGITYKIARNEKEISNTDSIATGDILTTSAGDKYTLIVAGDINKDGKVDLKDLIKIRKSILDDSNLETNEGLAADCNSDGKINLKDLVKIRLMILKKDATK